MKIYFLSTNFTIVSISIFTFSFLSKVIPYRVHLKTNIDGIRFYNYYFYLFTLQL